MDIAKKKEVTLRLISVCAGLALLTACGGQTAQPTAPPAGAVAAPPAIAAAPPPIMAPPAPAGGETIPSFLLGCGGPFTVDATPASLAAVFGAENVTTESLTDPEGNAYTATALFAKDPSRRVDISFADDQQRVGVVSLTVANANSIWTGPRGLKIGASLEDVERINGKPFEISGFGWDYGGFVSNWGGGALAGPDCNTVIRFSPDDAARLPDALLGDGRVLKSDDPAVRAVKPKVVHMGVVRPT